MTRRILGVSVDERFLEHRRRSTSLAAMAAAVVSLGLFEYELIRHHRFAWELFSVLLVMCVVKIVGMAWYHFTD